MIKVFPPCCLLLTKSLVGVIFSRCAPRLNQLVTHAWKHTCVSKMQDKLWQGATYSTIYATFFNVNIRLDWSMSTCNPIMLKYTIIKLHVDIYNVACWYYLSCAKGAEVCRYNRPFFGCFRQLYQLNLCSDLYTICRRTEHDSLKHV